MLELKISAAIIDSNRKEVASITLPKHDLNLLCDIAKSVSQSNKRLYFKDDGTVSGADLCRLANNGAYIELNSRRSIHSRTLVSTSMERTNHMRSYG